MPYFFSLSGGAASPTLMQNIFDAIAEAFTLVGEIVTQITAQPLLLFCLAASLIPVGIGIFRKLRHSVI